MKELVLKKGEERRLRVGHLWVFSNEVNTQVCDLKSFVPGEAVAVVSSNGQVVGSAYVNPASLICARMVSREGGRTLADGLLRERLADAYAWRERCFGVPYYRLCFSEGDLLPGLIVDRYGDTLVVQLTTAGMEAVKDTVAEVLTELCGPERIVVKNSHTGRSLEGLPTEEPYALVGDGAPDEVTVQENRQTFTAPLVSGQKTGWFYDQRLNRARFSAHASGARVLDLFSYVGSFGACAAHGGAAEITFVDQSGTALEYAERNCADVAAEVETVQGDFHEALEHLRDAGRTFDLISLDPPAFVKRKKDFKRGASAYLKAAQASMELLAPGGLLCTASCSQHFKRNDLKRTTQMAANRLGRSARIVEQLHQGPDHPVHPAMDETEYLKGFLVRLG